MYENGTSLEHKASNEKMPDFGTILETKSVDVF